MKRSRIWRRRFESDRPALICTKGSCTRDQSERDRGQPPWGWFKGNARTALPQFDGKGLLALAERLDEVQNEIKAR